MAAAAGGAWWCHLGDWVAVAAPAAAAAAAVDGLNKFPGGEPAGLAAASLSAAARKVV